MARLKKTIKRVAFLCGITAVLSACGPSAIGQPSAASASSSSVSAARISQCRASVGAPIDAVIISAVEEGIVGGLFRFEDYDAGLDSIRLSDFFLRTDIPPQVYHRLGVTGHRFTNQGDVRRIVMLHQDKGDAAWQDLATRESDENSYSVGAYRLLAAMLKRAPNDIEGATNAIKFALANAEGKTNSLPADSPLNGPFYDDFGMDLFGLLYNMLADHAVSKVAPVTTLDGARAAFDTASIAAANDTSLQDAATNLLIRASMMGAHGNTQSLQSNLALHGNDIKHRLHAIVTEAFAYTAAVFGQDAALKWAMTEAVPGDRVNLPLDNLIVSIGLDRVIEIIELLEYAPLDPFNVPFIVSQLQIRGDDALTARFLNGMKSQPRLAGLLSKVESQMLLQDGSFEEILALGLKAMETEPPSPFGPGLPDVFQGLFVRIYAEPDKSQREAMINRMLTGVQSTRAWKTYPPDALKAVNRTVALLRGDVAGVESALVAAGRGGDNPRAAAEMALRESAGFWQVTAKRTQLDFAGAQALEQSLTPTDPETPPARATASARMALLQDALTNCVPARSPQFGLGGY